MMTRKQKFPLQIILVALCLVLVRWGLKEAFLSAVPGNDPTWKGIWAMTLMTLGTGALFLFVFTLRDRKALVRK
jgi:hypothetical protein